MTRQRNRESLSQTIFTHCPYCLGNGTIKSYESTSIEIERALKKLLFHYKEKDLCLTIHPQLDNYLKENDKEYYAELARSASTTIEFKTKDTLHLTGFYFSDAKTMQQFEL
jgi:ribonuclease G